MTITTKTTKTAKTIDSTEMRTMRETTEMAGQEEKVFKILIVDDVPKNIQVAANILRDEQFQIAFAQNGKSALEQIRANLYDLVLLDIMMPQMDGLEVCEELKKDPETRDIPIIFLTAKTDTEDIVKGFEKGAVDYVTKPFNGAELLARVRTHLELSFAREKLCRANCRLRTLNATKDKFFSIIAHDLNNPIQSLLMSADLLKNHYDTMDEEKIRNYISKFYSNTQHIADLLQHLLGWARSQQGKLKRAPKITDAAKIIDITIQLLKGQAEKKDIHLSSNVPENTPLYADENMIKTVIRNLVSNAIKFTPEKGTVTISAVSTDSYYASGAPPDSPGAAENTESTGKEVQPGYIEITIADNGVGIAPEELDALFRIDTQKNTKGTAGEKGTGLGLILCKEFLEKNNGSIHARSEKGKGSEFILCLPQKAPPISR